MKKSQVLEEAKNSGMDEATYQALEKDFAQFPEDLSEEDLVAMEAILDEVESAERVASASLNQMADELERAEDDVVDASRKYVSRVAEDNLNAVNLVNDIVGE